MSARIALFPKSVARMLSLVAVALFVNLFAGSAMAAEPEPQSPQGVVNINTASVEQLMLLPRIGESKAQRIVELRQKAAFKSVNDLTKVKGIGLKSLRQLKPFVRVDGPTTLTSEAKVASASETSEAPPVRRAAGGGAKAPTPNGSLPK